MAVSSWKLSWEHTGGTLRPNIPGAYWLVLLDAVILHLIQAIKIKSCQLRFLVLVANAVTPLWTTVESGWVCSASGLSSHVIHALSSGSDCGMILFGSFSLVPRPRPTFHCLQYGKAVEEPLSFDFPFACGKSLGTRLWFFYVTSCLWRLARGHVCSTDEIFRKWCNVV